MSLITEQRPPHRQAPERIAAAATGPDLHVERTSIRFHDVPGGRVRIEVDVENRTKVGSAPTRLRLESAPLGAFLRWQPLATLAVPAIAPGAKGTVALETPRPRPRLLAGFGGLVPPVALRTATGFAPERPAPSGNGLLDALLGFFRKGPAAGLSADPFDLLARSQPHWAGNINVWVGRQPVERHMAPRLRVHPGRVNLAAFCVGDRRDRYAFHVERPAGWAVDLSELRRMVRVDWTEDPWEAPRWLALEGTTCLLCSVQPPIDCAAGALEVHVTRRSSGQTAVVELDLDPSAAGPGCYVA